MSMGTTTAEAAAAAITVVSLPEPNGGKSGGEASGGAFGASTVAATGLTVGKAITVTLATASSAVAFSVVSS